jgi:putative nucleotidyltransferase with HDIG domain
MSDVSSLYPGSREGRKALAALDGLVSFHHGGTASHSRRVSDHAERVGEHVGLDPFEIETVRWGGLLHDLGKLAVPASILAKPSRLTSDEYEIVKQHSDAGADLLLSLHPQLAPLADLARFHHERWDGSGYPRGLAGEEIPLGARIIAVVDVFNAMTEGRSYQAGPATEERALEELEHGAGIRYDAMIVNAFSELRAADALL